MRHGICELTHYRGWSSQYSNLFQPNNEITCPIIRDLHVSIDRKNVSLGIYSVSSVSSVSSLSDNFKPWVCIDRELY